jgi:hypothetical protein
LRFGTCGALSGGLRYVGLWVQGVTNIDRVEPLHLEWRAICRVFLEALSIVRVDGVVDGAGLGRGRLRLFWCRGYGSASGPWIDGIDGGG